VDRASFAASAPVVPDQESPLGGDYVDGGFAAALADAGESGALLGCLSFRTLPSPTPQAPQALAEAL
jgi:hypothetical protein